MAAFYRRDRAPAMFDFAPEKISEKNRIGLSGKIVFNNPLSQSIEINKT
jgi:hypothetical protein